MKWTVTKCWTPAQIKLMKCAFDFGVLELGLVGLPIHVRLAGRHHDYGMAKENLEVIIFYKDTLEVTVATMFHELTHIRQYVLGTLRNHVNGSLVWKTGEITSLNTKYDDQPWEIEAVRMEKVLSDAFFSC